MTAEKLELEARCYELTSSFAAMPMTGPGRWANLAGGITLYTNDDDILFADGSTITASLVRKAIHTAYEQGKTATQEFDRLRGSQPAISGDLSDLD